MSVVTIRNLAASPVVVIARWVGAMVAVTATLFALSAAQARGLDTPDQLDRERAVLAILARPEMRAAVQRVERLYRADPRAETAAGAARVRRAASSIGTAAANYALGEDASRTGVYWTVNAPHRWHGLSVPGSGFGIENPDNVYQGLTVIGGAHYRLYGLVRQPGPVQLHLEVRDSIPGTGEMLVEGGRQLATIQSEQLQFDPAGNFTIEIDSAPAAGRANHLAIPEKGTFNIGIRQLFTDWSTQRPILLRLERIDAAARPVPRKVGRLARRAAAILDRIAPGAPATASALK